MLYEKLQKKPIEYYISIQKNTNTIKEQTETRQNEPLEFILTKSLYIFSLKPASETEDEKSTSTVSKIEVYNFVFIICEHPFFTLQSIHLVTGKILIL